MKARRYNKGKPRHELLAQEAIEELVKVYTLGAEKYTLRDPDGNIVDDGANNWRKGQPFSESLGSVKRHIAAFNRGEDIDPDLGTHHLANAAWGLLSIITFQKTLPHLDDRDHWWKKPKKRVWLDLDGCCVSLEEPFLEHFGLPPEHPTDWDDFRFRELLPEVADDPEFWANLPRLCEPCDLIYPISGYCTSRTIDDEVTQKWLDDNGFPRKPLINVRGAKKSEALKGICDVFVDDGFHNFCDLQQNGIPCYLMTRPHNAKYDVGTWRVNSLQEFFLKVRDLT